MLLTVTIGSASPARLSASVNMRKTCDFLCVLFYKFHGKKLDKIEPVGGLLYYDRRGIPFLSVILFILKSLGLMR